MVLLALSAGQPAEAQTRVKWRFRLDADYSLHRPAIGPDGTVYVNTSNGKLYALTPAGVQKWVIQVSEVPLGNLGPVAVGADGTVYVAAPTATNLAFFAINPDGTTKWVFNQLGGTLMAGPSVGPDGNIYGVTETPGLGLFSLTPTGVLRYAQPNTWNQHAIIGSEIVFGTNSQLYFAIGSPTASLFGFGLDGSPRFQVPASSSVRPVAGRSWPQWQRGRFAFPDRRRMEPGGIQPGGRSTLEFLRVLRQRSDLP